MSTTSSSDLFGLPISSHASRIPKHINPVDVHRIRKAALNLPQVVKPSDFFDLPSDTEDNQLDQLGLVMLQKAVAGGRPSRWLSPDCFEQALQHLDVVGTGPTVRTTLAERFAVLETHGITRQGSGWQRQLMHSLVLPLPEWRVAVAHLVPIASEPVWAYFRTGDKGALMNGLGTAPPFAQADELHAHLANLINRSQEGHPQHVQSLLPRFQAECAKPQKIEVLKAACTRAQDRWEHQVAELDTMAGLNSELAFQGYPDSFPTARHLQRSVKLFVGPPNSGKTHAAFERLAQANQGAYLAPLRLLALEGRDRLVARGVPCSLLTGEENLADPNARVVSSTIEMVSTQRPMDVAVIDEAQMLFDTYRGWAWTQAIVAVPANEVIIICSSYAVSAIENLLHLCGERFEVRYFERKQQVQQLLTPVPIARVEKGDAIVAFSRRDVLTLRDQIAANGHAVSVIYGALPPEVRRREAERFAQGASHVLVATDAIGMGLNLPIRRVLFSTMTKFDGQSDRPLNESEVHQIAGRAGRYGMHDEGFAGVLKEAEPGAAKMLKELLPKKPRAPRQFKASVAPNWWHIDTISSRLHKTRLKEVLDIFMQQLQLDDAHFQVAELEQMLELAEKLDSTAAGLSMHQRFIYAQAPVDNRTESQVQEYLGWAHNHALVGQAGSPWFLDSVDDHSRLDRMEQALRSCTLWLWLDLRFEGVYGHVDEVSELRRRLNDGIERQLKGQRPLAQTRMRIRR
jgi:ATP-dependent RNA helicase SUPV3L1/SUV3